VRTLGAPNPAPRGARRLSVREREPLLVGVVAGYRKERLALGLERALDAGAARLVVDLGAADSLSTGALNALLAARGRLLERGGKAALVVRPELRRRLEALDFHRRFALASGRAEALRLLGVAGGDGELARPRAA
jgi:anti-anti-sigma regulatory factor